MLCIPHVQFKKSHTSLTPLLSPETALPPSVPSFQQHFQSQDFNPLYIHWLNLPLFHNIQQVNTPPDHICTGV